LLITAGDRCYVSRKYNIFSSDDWGKTWQLDCRVPPRGWKSLVARTGLAERLLRYYIGAFKVLDDGSRVAVARDGLYRAEPGETRMERVFTITRGSRPLNICADGQRVIFGEYGDCFKNLEVFIYISEDGGRTFHVGYTFPLGSIRHIHNVMVDPYSDHYWVFVGDHGDQPGIGALSKDLKSIDWLLRGIPESRVVSVILKPDYMLYGTDADNERNFIIHLDKKTAKISKLLEVEGSSLFSTSFGPVMAISTNVEPNPSCLSKECSIYISRDGDSWQRILPHRKDWYHNALFQYGTLVLPYSYSRQALGMFSGQAVVGAHNLLTFLDFDNKE
jgi:hypothetical protein